MRILDGILANEFEFDELQKFIGVRDGIKDSAEICEGLLVVDRCQRSECVSLASIVALGLKESIQEICGVWDEGFGVLENGCDSENGILSDVCVAVLETGARRGKERLDKFGLTELAEEAQRVTADVFVGVLEVISDAVTGCC